MSSIKDYSEEIAKLSGEQYKICHFKDSAHTPFSPPHHYISIPRKTSGEVFLCLITSQIENIQEQWKKESKLFSIPALIHLPYKHFPFLFKADSVIDTLHPFVGDFTLLQNRIHDSEDFTVLDTVPVDDITRRKLFAAIQGSDLLNPKIKADLLP